METIVAGFYSVALPDSRTQNIKHITWQATSSFHGDLALEKYFVLTPHDTRWMPNLLACHIQGREDLPCVTSWYEVSTWPGLARGHNPDDS